MEMPVPMMNGTADQSLHEEDLTSLKELNTATLIESDKMKTHSDDTTKLQRKPSVFKTIRQKLRNTIRSASPVNKKRGNSSKATQTLNDLHLVLKKSQEFAKSLEEAAMSEITNEHGDLENHQTKEDLIEKYQAEYNSLLSVLQQVQDKRHEIETTIAGLDVECPNPFEEIEKFKAYFDGLVEEVNNLENNFNDIDDLIVYLKKHKSVQLTDDSVDNEDIFKLKQGITIKPLQLEAEVGKLRVEIEELQEKLKAASVQSSTRTNETITILTNQLREADKKLKMQEEFLKQNEEKMGQLSNQLAEYENSEVHLNEEYERLQSEIEVLKQQLSESERTIVDLQNDKGTIEAAMAKTHVLDGQLEVFKKINSEQQIQIDYLRRKSSSVDIVVQNSPDFEVDRAEIQKLRRLLEENEAKNEDLLKQIESMKDELKGIEVLRNEVQHLQETKAQIETALRRNETQENSLHAEIEKLQKENNQLKEDAEKADKSKNQAEADNESLNEKINCQEIQLKEENGKLKAALVDAEDRIRSLGEMNEALKKDSDKEVSEFRYNYLRNIVIKFLERPEQRADLLEVLKTVLELTEEESSQLKL